ncbi:hypothetical protein NDU88_003909 [Pleurodeles waltl]|uniref:Uncharacterized protein n=1 Tax=Pleurodeles waltl TaxID=8319 RepID=A0AAV7V211_PLEWA|nr:hypothetical protein NDU88_003909 [Pleurodeles waltl]
MEGAAPGVPGGAGGACGLYESGQAQRDRAVKLDGRYQDPVTANAVPIVSKGDKLEKPEEPELRKTFMDSLDSLQVSHDRTDILYKAYESTLKQTSLEQCLQEANQSYLASQACSRQHPEGQIQCRRDTRPLQSNLAQNSRVG